MREVSSHLDTRLIYSCHKVRYNWKLNMENVKDYNHVPFVHPKTFLPVMTAPVRGLAREAAVPSEVLRLLQEGETPELRSLSFPTKAPIQPYKSWFSDLCEGYGDEHAYYNWFIYPNVNFCSVRGEHFLLQQYDPVAPGETDYHLWMMTARRKDPKTDFSALLSTLIRGERNVIGEDTLVLERLQEGLGAHSPPFMHGDYEVQLVRQHLWYRAQVLGRGHEAGDHRRGRARARTGGQYCAGTGTGTPGPGAECCGSTQLRYCASARTLPAAESEVFVALDERAVNYARHKLIADIRLAGYRLFDIVSPQAIVGEGVRLLGNVFVGAGCVLAGRARIGTGSWLELQVLVEEDCRVGTCSTLLAGVQLGRRVEIGQGSTLGAGSVALADTRVGRHCEWLLPGRLPGNYPITPLR